jgi:predicted transcriptional regulator
VRRLGDLEAVVMDRLWTAGAPLSVREVLQKLPDDRHRAYTTVMTVLDNLFRKGLVTREMRGRAYHYRAVATREQHTARVMEEVLSDAGDRATALLHFVEQITPEEALRLREALDQFADGADST